MLSYIASNSTKDLIIEICKELKITILNPIEEVDFLKYIKETKVNFYVIKYLIIDLDSLKNTEEEKLNSIKYFKEIYTNTRMIIIGRGYDNQNPILTELYKNGIYNIINAKYEEQIKEEIKRCLSEKGLQEKDVRRLKKIEETKVKSKNYKRVMSKIKEKIPIKVKNKSINQETHNQINSSVYFFALFIQAITKLLELVGIIIIFGLTSLGLTIVFNEPLRNAVVQMLGLK